ncbi:MAG: hypothetical protein JWQ64_2657 [Subtercola sp.]|nr:hypothetical protein [Subtercola sp.]
MTTLLPRLPTDSHSAATLAARRLAARGLAVSPTAGLSNAVAELSVAELSAARLDGDVYGLDDGYLSVAEPECRRLRALALARHLPAGVILERNSALWVYGVLARPPTPPQICIAAHRTLRATATTGEFVLREVVLREGDVLTIAGAQVTSPVRTVIDVARTSEEFGQHTLRRLAELITLERLTFDDLEQKLRVPRNLPHKNVALARVGLAIDLSAAAHAVDIVDSVDAAHGVENAVEVGGVTHFEHEAADGKPIA